MKVDTINDIAEKNRAGVVSVTDWCMILFFTKVHTFFRNMFF